MYKYLQYAKIIAIKIRNAILIFWEYKINILLTLITNTFLILTFFSYIFILYAHNDYILGMQKYEFLLYIIFFDITSQFINSFDLIQKITSGEYIVYITKPKNEIILLLNFYFENFIYLLIDIAIIIFLMIFYKIPTMLSSIFFTILLIFITTLQIIFIILTIQSYAFKYGSIYSLQNLLLSIFYTYDKIPITVLKNKIIFTIFLLLSPYAYFFYIITKTFTNSYTLKQSITHLFLAILTLAIIYIIFKLIYEKNKKYFEGLGG